MWDKPLWLFPGLLLFEEGHVAIVLRGKADLFFEEYAEGTNAFKTDLIANIRNA